MNFNYYEHYDNDYDDDDVVVALADDDDYGHVVLLLRSCFLFHFFLLLFSFEQATHTQNPIHRRCRNILVFFIFFFLFYFTVCSVPVIPSSIYYTSISTILYRTMLLFGLIFSELSIVVRCVVLFFFTGIFSSVAKITCLPYTNETNQSVSRLSSFTN